LSDHPEREQRVAEIKEITDRGMNGTLSFRESLEKRLSILEPHKRHLAPLITRLRDLVSRSFKRNAEFFRSHAEHIYIVSNGFRDFIVPIVTEYGILPANVLANDFIFDETGNITGFDKSNPLSANNGKSEQIRKLNLPGDVYVIGDGYTDYEIKKSG